MENILAIDLIKKFKEIYTEPPDWAYQLPPSIPLIGQTYKQGKGLLIYASAENLNRFDPTEKRYTGENAWNRYRYQYEDNERNSGGFFPDVGIQPMTNGGLFAAGLFIAEKFNLEKGETPYLFLETIAASNWCKFSIYNSKKNIDYLGCIEKLTVSLPYVVCELSLLLPKVVLIPHIIWNRPNLCNSMKSVSPKTLFLPFPQFGRWSLNMLLKKYDCSAKLLKEQEHLKDTLLASWMEKLRPIRGVKKDYAWRYIAGLDKTLKQN